MEEKISFEQVKTKYEKKYNCKITIHDWSTPELVAKYIEKHKLDSSSAEILLNTPELVAKYIEKHKLYPSSAEIIFSLLKRKGARKSHI